MQTSILDLYLFYTKGTRIPPCARHRLGDKNNPWAGNPKVKMDFTSKCKQYKLIGGLSGRKRDARVCRLAVTTYSCNLKPSYSLFRAEVELWQEFPCRPWPQLLPRGVQRYSDSNIKLTQCWCLRLRGIFRLSLSQVSRILVSVSLPLPRDKF